MFYSYVILIYVERLSMANNEEYANRIGIDTGEEHANSIADAQIKSAEVAADIRKQENEKRLQDYFEAEMLKRRRAYAAAMEELRNSHKVNKGTDRETTLWDEAMHEADRSLNSGELTSNHDFRSAMMAILAMYGKMNKAANTSVNQTFGEYYNKYVYEQFKDPVGRAWIGLKSKMRDAIRRDGDIDLPTFQHNISFKDGKVDIAALTRKDGAPLVTYERHTNGNLKLDERGQKIEKNPNPANEAFKSLVDAWFIENDYMFVRGEEGKYVHVTTGQPLNEARFNELKPSFAEFLKNVANADLSYEEQPSASPTMQRV